jgi:F-type H+-transporting ATPase subunit epsilon
LAATFHITILAADEHVYEGDVTSLVAHGRDGYFGILANHAPLIASLVPGKLILKDDSGCETCYCMSGGLLEVASNQVKILADSAELPESIDYGRACQAEERARERLDSGFLGEGIDLERALQALLRAINRKKIAEEFGHDRTQS